MQLTSEQNALLNKWIDEWATLLHGTCPACGHPKTFQAGEIVCALPYGESGMQGGGSRVIPMVQVICRDCRHVLLFDAIGIGLCK